MYLQFKFAPLPTESARTYLNCEQRLKRFGMHPICELCMQCGLLFMKNGVVLFPNSFLVGASQNCSFSAVGKWKMDFLCEGKENLIWQHCLPSQGAHMCIIWAHYHKLCRGFGHDQAHLPWKSWISVHGSSFLWTLFRIIAIFQIWNYYLKIGHIKWRNGKVFHIFWIF